MYICEAARKMKPLQKVTSKDAQKTLILDENGYWFYYVNEDGSIGKRFEFNANEFLADDWEIIWDKVDFWTAWQAYKNENKKISCELWGDINRYYYPGLCLSKAEINANWIILN